MAAHVEIELTLPELGMQEMPVYISLWLVEPGEPVVQGDRVVEVLAGPATVDLPAPTTGRMLRVLVSEDDQVATGQPLAVFESED